MLKLRGIVTKRTFKHSIIPLPHHRCGTFFLEANGGFIFILFSLQQELVNPMHSLGIITMWSQENLRQYFDIFSKPSQ